MARGGRPRMASPPHHTHTYARMHTMNMLACLLPPPPRPPRPKSVTRFSRFSSPGKPFLPHAPRTTTAGESAAGSNKSIPLLDAGSKILDAMLMRKRPAVPGTGSTGAASTTDSWSRAGQSAETLSSRAGQSLGSRVPGCVTFGGVEEEGEGPVVAEGTAKQHDGAGLSLRGGGRGGRAPTSSDQPNRAPQRGATSTQQTVVEERLDGGGASGFGYDNIDLINYTRTSVCRGMQRPPSVGVVMSGDDTGPPSPSSPSTTWSKYHRPLGVLEAPGGTSTMMEQLQGTWTLAPPHSEGAVVVHR